MPSLSVSTQSMDTVYPEPMSRLHRRVVPKKRRGGSVRYRTQPVTFSEIQEVDEENVAEDVTIHTPSTSKSDLDLLNQRFEDFKRTRDLMLSGKINETETVVIVDVNKNTLSTSRTIGRLPSRPSF